MRFASCVRFVVWAAAVMSVARVADAQDRSKGFAYLFVAPGVTTCQQGHRGRLAYPGLTVKTSPPMRRPPHSNGSTISTHRRRDSNVQTVSSRTGASILMPFP